MRHVSSHLEYDAIVSARLIIALRLPHRPETFLILQFEGDRRATDERLKERMVWRVLESK